MMQDDYAYYRRRAEAEFDRAGKADDDHAMLIHRQLAQAYLERAAALAVNAPVSITG